MIQRNLSPIQPIEADLLTAELVGMTPWRQLGYQVGTLRNYLLGVQQDFECLYLHVDGIPAGVIALRSPWLRGTLLELIALLPGFQHQGLGTWLMQWLTAHAQAKNQRNLWTLVSAFNEPALCFYQSQGFVRIGQLDYLIVEGQHELLLRYSIKNK